MEVIHLASTDSYRSGFWTPRDPFKDPSFGSMLDLLGTNTRVCLIEWLRKKGEYEVVRLPRPNYPNCKRGCERA